MEDNQSESNGVIDKKKKIFITGATGFIGFAFVQRLALQNFEITVFLRNQAQKEMFAGLKVNFAVGSLEDGDFLNQALNGQEIIVHSAGFLNQWGVKLVRYYQENVAITKNILRAAPKTLEKFIYLSTVHTLGVNHRIENLPLDEKVEPAPSTLYAQSKLAAEQEIKNSVVPWIIVRPAMVYGPGDTKGFMSNLIKLIVKSDYLPIFGQGDNYLHFIYIDDLIDALLRLIKKTEIVKQVYILAGDQPIKLRELINKIADKISKPIKTISLPYSVGKILYFIFERLSGLFGSEPLLSKDRFEIISGNRYFSIAKARREINFTPRWNYDNGLKQTLPEFFPVFNREQILEMIKTHEPPFFLFNEDILKNRYVTLWSSITRFYKNARIYYSAKTNFNHWVLTKLKECGSSIEIACGQELLSAQKAGFTPSQICFDGPVKTDDDIEYAISAGINYFNFDSLKEAEKVNLLAGKMNKKVRGGFRINLGIKGILQGPTEIYIKKFGVPLNEALAAYQEAAKLPNLIIETVSCHIGSQIIKIKPYLEAIDSLVDLAQQLEKTGITITEINIGGGYPSATLIKTTAARLILSFLKINFINQVPLLYEYGEAISKKFARAVKKLKVKPLLALEPGRSIAGPMGVLVSQVKIIKDNWIFIDGSKYFVPESAFFVQHKLEVLSLNSKNDKLKYNIAGSSLNTADIFAIDYSLPRLKEGDIILVADAGAYSISRAVPFTVLLPPIYALDNQNQLKLIRQKGKYEDPLARDIS